MFSMLMDMAEMDQREKDTMDIDKLLWITEKKYNSLVCSAEWSGVKSKGSHSTFTSQADNENNKHVIDGKHMFYLHKLKRWILHKCHPNNTTTSTNMSSTSTTPNPLVESPSFGANPAFDAALANTLRSIEASLHGLVNQFS